MRRKRNITIGKYYYIYKNDFSRFIRLLTLKYPSGLKGEYISPSILDKIQKERLSCKDINNLIQLNNQYIDWNLIYNSTVPIRYKYKLILLNRVSVGCSSAFDSKELQLIYKHLVKQSRYIKKWILKKYRYTVEWIQEAVMSDEKCRNMIDKEAFEIIALRSYLRCIAGYYATPPLLRIDPVKVSTLHIALQSISGKIGNISGMINIINKSDNRIEAAKELIAYAYYPYELINKLWTENIIKDVKSLAQCVKVALRDNKSYNVNKDNILKVFVDAIENLI